MALVPNREAYGELSGLISRARRRCHKGEYTVHLRDIIFHLKRCFLILLPDDQFELMLLSRNMCFNDACKGALVCHG